MFERRLKIMLMVIFSLAVVLFARSVQLQVAQHGYWVDQADKINRREGAIATSRGTIYDRKGIPLAFDAACIDAAVDYRAIVKDSKWITAQATLRLPPRKEKLPPGMTRKQLLDDEIEHVNADIDRMWVTIGTACDKSPEEIEQIKQDIQSRVELLKRNAWFGHYDFVSKGTTEVSSSSWRRWLMGDKDENVDKKEAALEASHVEVAEQVQTHVIVANLSDERRSALQKALPKCPGLELKESSHRGYDDIAGKVMPHVLGHLAPVLAEEVKAEGNLEKEEAFRYLTRDVVGRDGLERLAEESLRGGKGWEAHVLGKREPELVRASQPGRDVVSTIDLQLQSEIDEAFAKPLTVTENDGTKQEFSDLHGAAVVIDVKTGEVLAMVSHPGYDLKDFEANFKALAMDEINKPLMNRATQQAVQPGSTCKTIIGSMAVTTGVLSPTEGIECDGFLKVPDSRDPLKMRKFSKYRCWTARLASPVSHHSLPFPSQRNQYTGQEGFLSLSDGIERSCNVYFETVAWRMKMPGVIDALDAFGLGRPTGIGIPEVAGSIPVISQIKPSEMESTTFLAGIGQGAVTATPLQMANVSATLARGGIWMRPTLLRGAAEVTAMQAHPLPKRAFAESTRDLHLDSTGQAAIREGMIKVVRSPAGTGPSDREIPGIMKFFESLDVAGKTGSAQIADDRLRVVVRDEHGKAVITTDAKGKRVAKRDEYAIGSFPWFKGTGENHGSLAHAWFMGYAPAHDPQIAFCVLVEYGGSGGRVAGPVGREVLKACQRNGYLSEIVQPKSVASTGVDSETELLH